MEPAIDYAHDGFPGSPITASLWQHAAEIYRDSPGFRATFLLNGRAPRAGEILLCREQARTLEMIAETREKAFYGGEPAEAIEFPIPGLLARKRRARESHLSGKLRPLADLKKDLCIE